MRQKYLSQYNYSHTTFRPSATTPQIVTCYTMHATTYIIHGFCVPTLYQVCTPDVYT